MENITVKEYAELRGCSERYIRKLIEKGEIKAEGSFGKGGIRGMVYVIPLASIEPKLIRKYQRRKRAREGSPPPPPGIMAVPVNLEELTYEERQEVAMWKEVLGEWRSYRNGHKPIAEADRHYVEYAKARYPDLHLSPRILQRQWNAMHKYGDAALIDRRGKHGNHARAIPQEVWDIFEYYYLDESKPSIRNCMRYTQLQLQKSDPELLPLASAATFSKEILRSIPVPVLKYFRLGEKACHDECAPYIRRTYTDLYSNDIWVCDNHTFDVFVNDGEHSRPVRVYLTAFLDVRSRKYMGWYVTLNPCSDATLYALRRGIDKYGVPKRILSDNGREFLTFDIGGRGFRKSRDRGEHLAPTILDNLQIEFRTALVKNARAKIIERAFLNVKNDFSKLFEGYTGGTIAERPERLKKTGSDAENFIILDSFKQHVDTFIQGILNKNTHRGEGMYGRTPDEVYAECLYEKRTATKDQLNLMMLRNTRMQKVSRNGVYLSLYDHKIFWNSLELNYSHFGQSVYFRYDPDDLSEVRVYDEQDRFLCTAQQVAELSYYATKEEIAEAMRENRKLEKLVRMYKKQKGVTAESAFRLMMEEADRLMREGEELNPRIITPILERAGQEHKDSSMDTEPIDYTEALERLAAAK